MDNNGFEQQRGFSLLLDTEHQLNLLCNNFPMKDPLSPTVCQSTDMSFRPRKHLSGVIFTVSKLQPCCRGDARWRVTNSSATQLHSIRILTFHCVLTDWIQQYAECIPQPHRNNVSFALWVNLQKREIKQVILNWTRLLCKRWANRCTQLYYNVCVAF